MRRFFAVGFCGVAPILRPGVLRCCPPPNGACRGLLQFLLKCNFSFFQIAGSRRLLARKFPGFVRKATETGPGELPYFSAAKNRPKKQRAENSILTTHNQGGSWKPGTVGFLARKRKGQSRHTNVEARAAFPDLSGGFSTATNTQLNLQKQTNRPKSRWFTETRYGRVLARKLGSLVREGAVPVLAP